MSSTKDFQTWTGCLPAEVASGPHTTQTIVAKPAAATVRLVSLAEMKEMLIIDVPDEPENVRDLTGVLRAHLPGYNPEKVTFNGAWMLHSLGVTCEARSEAALAIHARTNVSTPFLP